MHFGANLFYGQATNLDKIYKTHHDLGLEVQLPLFSNGSMFAL
jgi:hypothetical protein